jgi:L-asparaginase II
LTSTVLQNQVHPPYDAATAQRLIRDGERPTVLRGNCSGKHAAMVLFAKASGWPIDSYWHPDHPVQRLALETISALSDVPVEEVATATDGCGVVTFGMPIRGLATAFARLADPSAVADPPLRSALIRIRDAMMAHPELVAGEHGRIDTALMRAHPSRVVSKGGAEGVLAMGIPPGALPEGAPFGAEPMGIALKVEDGNLARRAGDVTSIEVLRQLGLVADPLPEPLAGYGDPPIVDPRGERSGEVRPAFRLAPA